MSQVDSLTIFFVLRSENANEDESSDDMKLAYNAVLKYGATAKWIKPSSCLTVAASTKNVFVFEAFEGEVFQELKKNSGKIIGARCMLTCITSGRSIPSGNTPVFSEGMRDLVVCCTGFDIAAKKQIQEKVEYMAGIYVKSLRAITTHLVAYNNISPKAIEAFKSNLPVMRYEWIDEVWEKSKYGNINGADAEFKKFLSPLFHNLKITTSGIGRKEKEKIKELIETNGGTFSGVLEEKSTNILIVSKPEGEKFKFAKSWNIVCLKPSWIYNSVASKSIHPLNSYTLDSKNPKSSTPNKDINVTANFSMMSAIAHDSDKMVTHLEETGMTFSCDSTKSHFATPKRLFTVDDPCDIINNVLLKNLKDAGQFLDGCNIYLCEFNSEDVEKLKKVLNVGGATRFNELNDFVTHIIVGKKTESILGRLKDVSAHVLSINWLVESLKLKKPAPEADFLIFEKDKRSTEPPSPLSKLGAKLLTTTLEKKTVEKPQFCLEKENERLVQLEEQELLSRYKQSQPGEPLTPRENPLTRSTNSSSQSRSNLTQTNAEFFQGLSFFLSSELIDLEKKELEDIIVLKGGKVVAKRFLGVPDYAVVPICGASLTEITTKEVINVFFIKDCCFEDCIVPLQYYHQPVACVKNATPLTNCVISVSNYVQCEREFIESLIEILGATPQSLLARKPKENILKSTHLICTEPSGQKYNGAVRWGLPVVHHDWLITCAALGTRVSEQPYLIGESKLSNAPGNETKDNVNLRATSVDKVQAHPEQSCSKAEKPVAESKSMEKLQITSYKNSPVHSAVSRLRNTETPNKNSPDPNRTLTPNSPYGAFYGNDNPSPSTRKRLWKWMHQGADFPLDPPVNYQCDAKRRDSTPLSEVLSKLLIEMKRKPEDIPTDSPVSRNKRMMNDGELVREIPSKKINLDQEEVLKDDSMKHNSLITTGLQKMKEIEENYTNNVSKPLTPIRKQSDSAPQMLVITESQPHTEVGWEDPNEKEIALKTLEKAAEAELKEKVFMLTRLSNVEEVSKLIKQYGGKVSSLPHFDKSATHLITKDLTRDEKLMSSIAAGLWVLHPSYIDELRIVKDVNKISEEFYEWGNPNKTDRTTALSNNTKGFASCSYEWRLAIKRGEPPPFKDMKIILHLRPKKYENFRSLIEAGGGHVLNAKPPYKNDVADICIIDEGNPQEVDYPELAKKNIPCVTILYLSDRILKKVDAVQKNIVQPFLKYWKKISGMT